MTDIYKTSENTGLTFAHCIVCTPLPLKGRVFKIQKKSSRDFEGFYIPSPVRA